MEGWNPGHGVEQGLALAAMPRKATGRGHRAAQESCRERCTERVPVGTEQC